jgi:hypothetical protein
MESESVVDEPLGARSSLGLTLWHLGHSADAIKEFHQWLETRKIAPESLLPSTLPAVPNAAQRILIEPELLEENHRNGWQVEGGFLTSSALDTGPDVDIPLRVPRSGFYRAWIGFEGWTDGTAVTSFRVYRAGRENETPLVSDEIHDQPVPMAGLNWKDWLINLPEGQYTLRFGHVKRSWHATHTAYRPRKIDCVYLTEAVWDETPEASVTAMRVLPAALQRDSAMSLTAADKVLWKRWQVRPISWEARKNAPELFKQSRAFWRSRVEELSRQEYPEISPPDYREPVRQNIFDDEWNMVGNPVRIRKQKEALAGDISAEPSDTTHYWLQAGDFETLQGQWSAREDGALQAGYGDFGGVAKTSLAIAAPGKYFVWVRFHNLKGYFAPWRVTVTAPGGDSATFAHDLQEYSSEWQRVGAVEMKAAGAMTFEIAPLPYKAPGTYRVIHDLFATTDENYVPQGNARPPFSVKQYEARLDGLGATAPRDFIAWLQTDPYRNPLSQAVWSKTSWPPAKQGEAIRVLSSSTPRITTTPVTVISGTRRGIGLYLRAKSDEPLQVEVECGPLQAGAQRIENKTSWRVIGFVPYGRTRQEWSPFALLRRPWVSIPPRGVAGLWLTLDARGVTPGEYSVAVTLKANGLEPRTLLIPVRVPNIAISPKSPVLVGGYGGGPEGEVYQRDLEAHGLNVLWNVEMSHTEMQKRGVHLLLFAQWENDETAIRQRIARLKELGLNYADWAFTVRDEPTGSTAEDLTEFIAVAQMIRRVDHQARISFNPGEAATSKTFETLDPWCDLWIAYVLHLQQSDNTGEGEKKRAIFMRKPWLWYTTPAYWDKEPDYPSKLRQQISSIPSQGANCLGTAFFAYYYPFRDAWDTAYEHTRDASIHVLPSRHGPVATVSQEAMSEGVVLANLGQQLREKTGKELDEAAIQALGKGNYEALFQMLRSHGS